MTAKQKAARAKFKAVVKEAAKLRKKNPKLTQAQAVKQAWAISYSKERKGGKLAEVGKVKKKAAVKKAVKKSAVAKKSTRVKAKKGKSTEMHTDTKSHNVNIRVVSGIKKDALEDYEKILKRIDIAKFKVLFNDEQAKLSKRNTATKRAFLKAKEDAKKYLHELETHARELKKHI